MTLKYIAPSTPLAIVVGTLVGGLAATLLGPLVMRRRGIYFAMITIAIGQLFYFVIVRWNEVTGGEDGLAGFSRQDIHLGDLAIPLTRRNFYYLVLICFTIAVAIMWTLLQSPLGHTWVAIRENRRRMEFLGVRVERYVWAAFAIAGFITAFAGTLNALLFNFTSPQDLHWILSGNFVIMIVLGGMRSFFGPAARRDHFRRRAGLSVERHRQLDELYRHDLRSHRAAVPKRRARRYSNAGGGRHDGRPDSIPAAARAQLRGGPDTNPPGGRNRTGRVAAARERVPPFRPPEGGRRCFIRHERRRASRRDRPKRRRQNHVFQSDQRPAAADSGPDLVRRQEHHQTDRSSSAWRKVSSGRSRSPKSCPILPFSRTFASPWKRLRG